MTTDSDIVSSLAKTGLPAVALSSSGRHGIPSVDVDNPVGARMATEHLVSLGHRRIVHLSGDDSLINAIERRDAFTATLTEADLSVPTG